MTLKVTGEVKPRWTWSPANLIFDDVPGDEESVRTITITQPASLEEGIRFVGTPEFLSARVEAGESTEQARTWQVTFTTVPPLKPGRQHGFVTIDMANSAGQPGPTVPVTVIASSTPLSGE